MRRALVTGGSRGIGAAIALQLRREGYRVITLSRSKPELFNESDEWIQCDVLSWEGNTVDSIPSALSKIKDIDILINNVGGGGRWGEGKMPEQFHEWNSVFQKNAGVAVQFTKHFLPYMRHNKWGRVITISSIFGKEAGGKPWFVMAKAAEIALMKSLAHERIPGVTFNTICPGYINVEGKPWQPDAGTPEDVAHLASFLASDKANYINGACITIDGGESVSY